MEGGLEALLGLLLMIALLILGVPIGFALGLAGMAGMFILKGAAFGLGISFFIPYASVSNYIFAAVPMFVFFGYLAERTKIAKGLYQAAAKWLRFLPGGLYAATIFSGGVFGAACGSSVASCALFSTLAAPEMRKMGYNKNLVLGAIAAGGTLAPTIPPSIALVIYAVITRASIIKLFAGAMIPGIIQMLLLMATVVTLCIIRPKLAPKTPPTSLREKLVSLSGVWPMLLVSIAVLGSIYAGIATVTESASVGAFVGLVIVLVQRQISWTAFKEALVKTVGTTVMILVITIGGGFFGQFVEVAGFSKGLYNFLTSLPYSQYVIVAIIALIYLILGFFLDGITILVVSVPLLAPIMLSLGYDLIWLGVWVTILIEIGTITPPVAVNLFVVAGAVEDATLGECIRGVIPFYIPLLILLTLITAFPILIHWLAGLI